MKFILPILIFLSLLLSKETITEVTETYPDGLPKEVTVYALVKDLSGRIEDNQLAPSILLFSIKISVSLIISAAIIG